MLAATWTSTIATAGLLILAIITAIFAIKAFGKQADEVKTVKKQAADQRAGNEKLAAAADLHVQDLQASLAERKREAAERERAAAELHRAQASRVFLWAAPGLAPMGMTQNEP